MLQTDIQHPTKGSRKIQVRASLKRTMRRLSRVHHSQDSMLANLDTTNLDRTNTLPTIQINSHLVYRLPSLTTLSHSIHPIKIPMGQVAHPAILCLMEAAILLSTLRIAKMLILQLDSHSTLLRPTKTTHSHPINSLSQTTHHPVSQEAQTVHCIPQLNQVVLLIHPQVHTSLPLQVHTTLETTKLFLSAHSLVATPVFLLRRKPLSNKPVGPYQTPVTALKILALLQHLCSHHH